jgi:hypothetical protein
MVDPVNRIADDHEIPFISDQEFDRTIRQAFHIGWVSSLAAQTLLRPRMAVSEPPNVYSSPITKSQNGPCSTSHLVNRSAPILQTGTYSACARGIRCCQSTTTKNYCLGPLPPQQRRIDCAGSTRNDNSQRASSNVFCRPCSSILSLSSSKVSVSNQGHCVRTSQFLILRPQAIRDSL